MKKVLICMLTVFAVLTGLAGCTADTAGQDESLYDLIIEDETSAGESLPDEISSAKTDEVSVYEEPEVTEVSEEMTESIAEESSEESIEDSTADDSSYVDLWFRTKKQRDEHYEKHGIEMGFDNADDYRKAASKVVSDPEALHKTEKEDGDDVYYLEKTNEFVVVSKDGYLRTYFKPDKGKAYYDKQ